MKLLDDQGRLFGKINLLDLLIILVFTFALLAASAYLFFPGTASKILRQEATWTWMEVEVRVSDPHMASMLGPGDVQKNPDGEVFAQIKGVRTEPDRSVQVTLRVRARVWRTGIPMFGSVPLRAGAPFEFITDRYLLEGTILNVRNSP